MSSPPPQEFGSQEEDNKEKDQEEKGQEEEGKDDDQKLRMIPTMPWSLSQSGGGADSG